MYTLSTYFFIDDVGSDEGTETSDAKPERHVDMSPRQAKLAWTPLLQAKLADRRSGEFTSNRTNI
jgi:hypothetical protein